MQKAPKGIKCPEKANIGTFKHTSRIIFSRRLFKNILYLYPTTIKTIKSRQKRQIKTIDTRFVVRFVIEGQIIYRKRNALENTLHASTGIQRIAAKYDLP